MLPFKFRMSEPLHNIIIIRNPPKFSSFGCRWKLCLVKCSCTGMCDVRVLSKTRTLGCLWPQWSPKETIPTTACTNPMPQNNKGTQCSLLAWGGQARGRCGCDGVAGHRHRPTNLKCSVSRVSTLGRLVQSLFCGIEAGPCAA